MNISTEPVVEGEMSAAHTDNNIILDPDAGGSQAYLNKLKIPPQHNPPASEIPQCFTLTCMITWKQWTYSNNLEEFYLDTFLHFSGHILLLNKTAVIAIETSLILAKIFPLVICTK